MRFFKKKDGKFSAFPDSSLTVDEKEGLISSLEESLLNTSEYSAYLKASEALLPERDAGYQESVDLLSMAKANYESCDEYLALSSAKSIKVWIPEDADEISEEDVYALKNPVITEEQLSVSARAKRVSLISEMSWRYERHASEIRLGIETTDSIEALDEYAQALRDITEQEGFPSVIDWPEAP